MKTIFHRFPVLLLLVSTAATFAQNRPFDILHASYDIRIDTARQTVEGKAVYQLRVLQNTDSLVWDAAPQVKVDQAGKYGFLHRDNRLVVYGKFRRGRKYTIDFRFKSKPVKGMYFTGWGTGADQKQVWTQGQGKNNSSWMPGIDDSAERFTWDIRIAFPAGYRIVSNGRLTGQGHKDGLQWAEYRMDKPVTYYLLFVGAGPWAKLDKTVQNTPYENYFYGDTARARFLYRADYSIRRCLEQIIGMDYPWEVYRQIPLRDFFYGGMENVTATTYLDSYLTGDTVIDPYTGRNTLAHELAHQWFGDYVTEKSPTYHWIHESFATWLARQTDSCLAGNDYYQWQYYDDRRRIIDAYNQGDTIPLENGKASTLTFYQKGAWILRMLRRHIGSEAFRHVMQDFLRSHPYGTVTTADFQQSLYRVTGDSMPRFFDYWFRHSRIPAFRVTEKGGVLHVSSDAPDIPLRIRVYDRFYRPRDYLLRDGDSLQLSKNDAFYLPNPDNDLLAQVEWQTGFPAFLYGIRAGLNSTGIYRFLKQIRLVDYKQKQRIFADMARNNYLEPVYEEMLLQMPTPPDSLDKQIIADIFRKGPMEKLDVFARLDSIPADMEPLLSTALDSPSPTVRMYALLPLWSQFPEKRKAYLDRTKGFDDSSTHALRMIWIILAVETPDYLSRLASKQLIDELIEYASPRYNAETRAWALTWIGRLGIATPRAIEYARLAAKHFNPSLRNQARETLEKLHIPLEQN